MLPAILTLEPKQLIRVERFEFIQETYGDGRIELWEHPHPDHQYVMGADFALGLEGRDYDAACILDTDTFPVRQVAELHGHWGPSFDRVLFAAHMYYNEAFILGERQFGLDRLRSLLNDYGVGWMYYDRDEVSRSRKITDSLGYWRGPRDICVPKLRKWVRERKVLIRSKPTLDQLRKLQYAPAATTIDVDKAMDKHMGLKLSGGGSPDLVMAAAYAVHAVDEVPHFPKTKRTYKPNSLGTILEHHKLDSPKAQGWRERRRRP